MIRFLILVGYFEITMYLQLTGKLNQSPLFLSGIFVYDSVLYPSSCAAYYLDEEDGGPQSFEHSLGQTR